MNVRFAAAIIWVVEQDKVARALKSISASTIPKPRALSDESLMYQWNEA